MMGAGKSAVGAALAKKLGRDFIDTDREIETRAGRSIGAIFAEDGEDAFRALERETIEGLAATHAVVALGGGAIAQPGLSERLRSAGVVVYLRAAPDALAARLEGREDRPLLAGLDRAARRARLAELLAERESAYESATVSVDTEGLAVSAVVEAVCRRISDANAAAGGAE